MCCNAASSPLRCDAAVSHCGNDAKYCARSSVSKLTPAGVTHSFDVSARAKSASAASISRSSDTTGPLSPDTPGATSHSDPRSRSWRMTSSGDNMIVEWEKDRRDARDRLEIVHPDVRVGDRLTGCLLSESDQLENPGRGEQPRREQRRLAVER